MVKMWDAKIKYKRSIGDAEGETEIWHFRADGTKAAAILAETRAETERRRRGALEARVMMLIFTDKKIWEGEDKWERDKALEAEIRREREREGWKYQ